MVRIKIEKEFSEKEILEGLNGADLGQAGQINAEKIIIKYDDSGATFFTAVDQNGEEWDIEVIGGLTKEQIETYTAGEIFNLPWVD